MIETQGGAAAKSREPRTAGGQERLVEQFRTRIAELENTNRLLLRELEATRRAELSRRRD